MHIKQVSYYQRLNCHAYYREGIQKRISAGQELTMLSFFENGIFCISEFNFQVNDVLILNIHIDRYPYDKLMCHVMESELKGEMYELRMEIMGIPNTLNERLRESLEKLPQPEVKLSAAERKLLLDLMKRLTRE